MRLVDGFVKDVWIHGIYCPDGVPCEPIDQGYFPNTTRNPNVRIPDKPFNSNEYPFMEGLVGPYRQLIVSDKFIEEVPNTNWLSFAYCIEEYEDIDYVNTVWSPTEPLHPVACVLFPVVEELSGGFKASRDDGLLVTSLGWGDCLPAGSYCYGRITQHTKSRSIFVRVEERNPARWMVVCATDPHPKSLFSARITLPSKGEWKPPLYKGNPTWKCSSKAFRALCPNGLPVTYVKTFPGTDFEWEPAKQL